ALVILPIVPGQPGGPPGDGRLGPPLSPGGGGGPLDSLQLAPPDLALISPLLAWLSTTIVGLLLFVFLIRRGRLTDEEPAFAFATPAGIPATASLVLPSVSPPPVVGQAPANLPLERAPTRFEHPPKPGVERLVVTYRGVRLSASADDLRSTELGRLERGDEVELLDADPRFLMVRTPRGLTGWIPRHTAVAATASDD
ncbi:MAG: hypothetical protein ACJ761_01400, partial [Chloroflexota bacterium]